MVIQLGVPGRSTPLCRAAGETTGLVIGSTTAQAAFVCVLNAYQATLKLPTEANMMKWLVLAVVIALMLYYSTPAL
ncbi:hypothetical protein [Burkholderia sp. BCC1970]|uniref:hypothetical protein n=1 Tax=Burkholderia sp. BCC1970 TaxID=2817437 RepID=UPI002ABDC013|nr:hypothetical protein [Burkholderia sp. BCC1970]